MPKFPRLSGQAPRAVIAAALLSIGSGLVAASGAVRDAQSGSDAFFAVALVLGVQGTIAYGLMRRWRGAQWTGLIVAAAAGVSGLLAIASLGGVLRVLYAITMFVLLLVPAQARNWFTEPAV